MENEIVIRKFNLRDRQELRIISCATAFMGQPGNIFFDGDDSFADFLTLYFTDYEPESCFVAERRGHLVGYLIGAKDSGILAKTFIKNIAPRLFIKAICSATFLKKKNLRFIFSCFLSFLKKEFKEPDFSQEYPAVLHINLTEGARGSGIGSRLINVFLEYLRQGKINGVHLATMSDHASIFFQKQGFQLLYRAQRSYFSYILQKKVPLYIYGRKFSQPQ